MNEQFNILLKFSYTIKWENDNVIIKIKPTFRLSLLLLFILLLFFVLFSDTKLKVLLPPLIIFSFYLIFLLLKKKIVLSPGKITINWPWYNSPMQYSRSLKELRGLSLKRHEYGSLFHFKKKFYFSINILDSSSKPKMLFIFSNINHDDESVIITFFYAVGAYLGFNEKDLIIEKSP